eukprot:TRINITY_DN10988_c0_g1_i2.p1 TRINITY_DN10988_c0_g1~~TRINITY_DN10988_c0_g1_i2.p1  ORF type:complete len:287 (+),score=53.44 TRINITY_DN10988_c0_g1_i2:90-950(+)
MCEDWISKLRCTPRFKRSGITKYITIVPGYLNNHDPIEDTPAKELFDRYALKQASLERFTCSQETASFGDPAPKAKRRRTHSQEAHPPPGAMRGLGKVIPSSFPRDSESSRSVRRCGSVLKKVVPDSQKCEKISSCEKMSSQGKPKLIDLTMEEDDPKDSLLLPCEEIICVKEEHKFAFSCKDTPPKEISLKGSSGYVPFVGRGARDTPPKNKALKDSSVNKDSSYSTLKREYLSCKPHNCLHKTSLPSSQPKERNPNQEKENDNHNHSQHSFSSFHFDNTDDEDS